MKDRVKAVWVDEVIAKQYFVDLVSALRRFSLMRGARFTLRTGIGGCRLVLLEGCGSLSGDTVVGRRVVSLYLLAFFSLR